MRKSAPQANRNWRADAILKECAPAYMDYDSEVCDVQAAFAKPLADISSYRQRAEELATLYETAIQNKQEPAMALGLLGMKLQELIDDLRSINAPEAEFKSLVELKEAITKSLSDGNTAGIPSDDILQVLRAFAGARKTKPGLLKRLQFWK